MPPNPYTGSIHKGNYQQYYLYPVNTRFFCGGGYGNYVPCYSQNVNIKRKVYNESKDFYRYTYDGWRCEDV